MPENFNEKNLSEKTVSIKTGVNFENVNYSFFEGSSFEIDSVINIWPNYEKKRLVLGKPFTKIIHVKESQSSQTENQKIEDNLLTFLKMGTTGKK